MQFCMKQGVSFKLIQQNILNLKPALIISKDEVDNVLTVLHDGLMQILKSQHHAT